MARYDADLADPALERKLDEALSWVEHAGSGGLPQFRLEKIPLLGAQTPESLQAAMDRLRRKEGAAGDVGPP